MKKIMLAAALLTFSVPAFAQLGGIGCALKKAQGSKQKIDDGAFAVLQALAQAADFDGWRAKMFAGEIVNTTEQRPAMHWALRDPDNHDEVRAVWERMHEFGHEIAESGDYDAIIHLGIGGSTREHSTRCSGLP